MLSDDPSHTYTFFFSKYFQSLTFLYHWDFDTRICDSPCPLSSLEGKAPHLHIWNHWGWQRSSADRVAFRGMGVWGRVATLTLKEELGHGLATNIEGYGHLENTCHLSPVTRPRPPHGASQTEAIRFYFSYSSLHKRETQAISTYLPISNL